MTSAHGYGYQQVYRMPPPQPAPPRDGRGIAALVTGLLGLAVLPLALGISAVRRRRAQYGRGSPMGVAGIILGSLQLVLYLLVGGVLLAATAHENTVNAGLRAACADGELAVCDELYQDAPKYSLDETFGDTCAGRQAQGSRFFCVDLDSPTLTAQYYGDDPALDALWDACRDGDLRFCDDLYTQAPSGSQYLDFAQNCGEHGSDGRWCISDYGDDPDLDAFWAACVAGDWAACDDLYLGSRPGTRYEEFGATCGDRTPGDVWCTEESGLNDPT